jgi:hypothetical protein
MCCALLKVGYRVLQCRIYLYRTCCGSSRGLADGVEVYITTTPLLTTVAAAETQYHHHYPVHYDLQSRGSRAYLHIKTREEFCMLWDRHLCLDAQ